MGTDAVVGDVKVRIEQEEWEEVSRRLRFSVEPDERATLGNIGLVLGGGRRRWYSTDGLRLVVFDAGPDHREATFLVSPRLLDAWPLVAAGTGAAFLTVRSDAGPTTISLEGPGGSLLLDHESGDGDEEPLDVDQILSDQLALAGVSFTIDAEALHELLRLARIAPAGPFLDEDHDGPLMWLTASDGSLGVEVTWEGLGTTRYTVPVDGGGDALVSANPLHLFELAQALEPGEVTVTIPADAGGTFRVQQGALTGLLIPIDPTRAVVKHVETVLSLLFGDDVIHTDPDGDYPLSAEGIPIYARIMAGSPIRVAVFAQVLIDIELDEDLLVELNQLNASTGMVKVLWVNDTVMVAGELVAATLDPEELAAVYERVNQFADGLGPALAARFGGRALQPSQELRWADYRNALIRAELVPGEWLVLNGPDATARFPFSEPVYVITAHDPHGRRRPSGVNAQDHARLAADLVATGAGIVRAVGGSNDGSTAEDSFLAWGIGATDALRVAGQYGQDAIFELTEETVTIIDVASGHRDPLPRHPR
jgi:hypothetical protein